MVLCGLLYLTTTAMSDLKDTLIIQDFDTSTISLKIYNFLITFSIISEVIERLVLSRIYKRPRIFKYNLDY